MWYRLIKFETHFSFSFITTLNQSYVFVMFISESNDTWQWSMFDFIQILRYIHGGRTQTVALVHVLYTGLNLIDFHAEANHRFHLWVSNNNRKLNEKKNISLFWTKNEDEHFSLYPSFPFQFDSSIPWSIWIHSWRQNEIFQQKLKKKSIKSKSNASWRLTLCLAYST